MPTITMNMINLHLKYYWVKIILVHSIRMNQYVFILWEKREFKQGTQTKTTRIRITWEILSTMIRLDLFGMEQLIRTIKS